MRSTAYGDPADWRRQDRWWALLRAYDSRRRWSLRRPACGTR